MDELFLPSDESSVEAMTQLPNDIAAWPQFIIERLRSRFTLPDNSG